MANYYGALYHSFNYRDNTYTINLKSGKPGTQTKVVSCLRAFRSKLRNEVMASTKMRMMRGYTGTGGCDIINSGTIRLIVLLCGKGAIHHPDACFRAELEKRLKGKVLRWINKDRRRERHAC